MYVLAGHVNIIDGYRTIHHETILCINSHSCFGNSLLLKLLFQELSSSIWEWRFREQWCGGHSACRSDSSMGILECPLQLLNKLLWSCSSDLHHHWHLDYYKGGHRQRSLLLPPVSVLLLTGVAVAHRYPPMNYQNG